MNIKILLIFIISCISSYANNTITNIFVVQKNFDTIQQSIKQKLTKVNYKVKLTDSKIFEIYFDTPELFYLKNNGYIKYQATQYVTKKKNLKYHEYIDYTLDGNSNDIFPVKHYKNVKSLEEKHPLLALVKRKQRHFFIDKILEDGIKYPMRLKTILEVSKLQHTFNISLDDSNFANISINQVEVSAVGIKKEFIYLKIFIDHAKLQLLLNFDNQEILNFFDSLKKEFVVKNEDEVSSEYLMTFNQMKKNIDLFNWLIRYPYLVNCLYSISFGFFGVIIILIIFRRRLLLH